MSNPESSKLDIVLDDAACGFKVSFPPGLPVIGAGVLPAGNDEDVDFGCFHGRFCLTDAAA